MYVSYLLEKEGASMYPGPVRHAGGLNLSAAQNFVGAPQYPDYGAYHLPAGLGLDAVQAPPSSPWPAAYGAPLRDDWGGYGQGTPSGSLHGPPAYSPAGDFLPHPHQSPQGHPAPPCALPPSAGHVQPLGAPPGPEQLSPGAQRRTFCDWIRKPTAGATVKTRTKDKYRVVYTDHQRLELEKEFHYSRYITIRRKAELAAMLGLSERQVKIWFQNRRAKERKITKKKMQQSQPGVVHSGSEPMSPVSSMQPGATGSIPSGGVLEATALVSPAAQ